MAFALSEISKLTQSRLEKAVILDLLRQSPVMQMIPVDNVDALRVDSTRWQTLPSSSTRKIGGSYTESTGTVEQTSETLFAYGGDVKVDRLLTKVKALENPLELNMKMKVASVAALFNDHFINGDHALGGAYIDGFEGIKKRVGNQPARMTINLAQSGDSLKVLASTANEHTFIDAVHEALHKVGAVPTAGPTGTNIAIFANESTILGIPKVLRRLATVLSTYQDAFDRTWTTWGPAKLVDMGYKSDQTTEIITSTEDPGDAGNDATSMYVVRFGGIMHKDASGKTSVMDDDGLRLLQLSGTSLEPYDPLAGGEGGAGAAPELLRRIDVAWGLNQKGRYSICRISGFRMAAS
jgi:hypothetical protein